MSSGFRQSLEELMQTVGSPESLLLRSSPEVNSAEPHFIRCLKPNAAKATWP